MRRPAQPSSSAGADQPCLVMGMRNEYEAGEKGTAICGPPILANREPDIPNLTEASTQLTQELKALRSALVYAAAVAVGEDWVTPDLAGDDLAGDSLPSFLLKTTQPLLKHPFRSSQRRPEPLPLSGP